ncbi:polyubiquitin binding protein-like protein [Tothia fuscella]|uniref:Polyubiquitin binding protein-like protein n=1 Tax=Tothia fuscella TaxID=1048955 RepID=A0A9P4TZL8_9PEZI|nr:polyubiquitin binding protein-like protein [Tothia fuscella]
MGDFKLSASLEEHDDDVRSVAFPHPSYVLSASRDKTVRIWKLLSPSPPTYDATIVSHGSDFVNSVAYASPSSAYSDGLIIAGGRDAIIEVRQPGKLPENNAEALLLGHAGNVCALDVSQDGTMIVSGSWDTEARVWQVGKWETSTVLQGHTAAVWAVSVYDKETILTGSADKLIHVYHPSGKLTRRLKGSPDIVRALCSLPPNHWSGAHFASAGNDAVIRFWTLDGHIIGELRGHENFIYTLAVLPTGELASSSEDRTVRIWDKGQCVQVITHPAISVWSVAACKDSGDIVTGASDKITRIFSRSADRQATPDAIRAFEESVKASAIPQESIGSINKTDLPGPEFLTQKSGTKEGQVQMIKEGNGNISAHQWSTAANQWINIGTVVDSSGSGTKTSYGGKEYDYVFDVDIEEGKPALKLPFNTTQNPYEVARKFIDDNELPVTYLDQVANFIVTNSQGATLGQSQNSGAGSDPWGSEYRYRPGEGSTPNPAPATRPKVLPQTKYLSIDTANLQLVRKKVEEFNQALISDGNKGVALNPNDIEVLASTVEQLEAVSKKADPSSPVSAEGIDLIVRVATTWPPEKRLPGLDLLRLFAAASEQTVRHTNEGGQTLIDVLDSSDNISANAPLNNSMMAIRTLGNLFTSDAGRKVMSEDFDKVHTMVEPFISSPNRNMIIAITTLYINYAVLLSVAAPDYDSDRVVTLLNDLTKIINSATDSEALYRALVGAGTLLALEKDFRELAKEAFDFDRVLARAEKVGVEPRIKHVIKEIRDQFS